MTEEANEITLEQAQSVLAQARQSKMQQCQSEVDAILQKYGCALIGQPIIRQDGTLGANVVLVEVPPQR